MLLKELIVSFVEEDTCALDTKLCVCLRGIRVHARQTGHSGTVIVS